VLRRYQVVLYKPDRYQPSASPCWSMAYRTLALAEMHLTRAMAKHPKWWTTQGGQERRSWFGEVFDRKRQAFIPSASQDPPWEHVQSVADVGYW
jgi:hypothetical protein